MRDACVGTSSNPGRHATERREWRERRAQRWERAASGRQDRVYDLVYQSSVKALREWPRLIAMNRRHEATVLTWELS